MPKQLANALFKLIKTLTRAEKRHFKVYVSRTQSSENPKFVQLFDALDKMKKYDENIEESSRHQTCPTLQPQSPPLQATPPQSATATLQSQH